MGRHEHRPPSGYLRAPGGLPALVVAYCAFGMVGGVFGGASLWQFGAAAATAVAAWFWPREPARLGRTDFGQARRT